MTFEPSQVKRSKFCILHVQNFFEGSQSNEIYFLIRTCHLETHTKSTELQNHCRNLCLYFIKVLTELMIDCENCENLVHCRDT